MRRRMPSSLYLEHSEPRFLYPAQSQPTSSFLHLGVYVSHTWNRSDRHRDRVDANRASCSLKNFLSSCKWSAEFAMGAQPLWPHVGLLVILVQFLLGIGFGNCTSTMFYFDTSDLNALQTLWGEWNSSTDRNSSLAGWSSEQQFPCPVLFNPDVSEPNWRGVLCNQQYCVNGTNRANTSYDLNCVIAVISLSLHNASILGTLPWGVSSGLTSLVILELTGNPDLTGTLPTDLDQTKLQILDLHNNAFTGSIPPLQGLLGLLQLDLSGNQLIGTYPLQQLSTMNFLQVLSIGSNLLDGEIPDNAFLNKTELEKLDISNNRFTAVNWASLSHLKKLLYLDVSRNRFTGPLPNLQRVTTLRTVNLSRNGFTGTVNLQNILSLTDRNPTSVDLSYNKLTGSLPSWTASNLGSIQELYLDNNTLTGTLNISQMKELGLLQLDAPNFNNSGELRIMSLINNSIDGVIYDSFCIDNVSTIFNLQGNPYCKKQELSDEGYRCYCTQKCYINRDESKAIGNVILIAAISSVLAVMFIVIAVVSAILFKNRRYRHHLRLQLTEKFEQFDVKPNIYSYNELRTATRDFHDDMKLGQGGYGAVFKGEMPNGHIVAVKQLFVKKEHGLSEFLNEVVLITGMKHRNLVNLKGCCLRDNQRLLVYDYVDNYDIEQILLGPKKQVVSWPGRLNICLGVARGLHYLHALAHPKIIHRDIKASNILLDKNLEPKIADFGLALLFPDKESHIMTVHVAGTKGYLAPEYASLGQLSDKADVYSFGVVCLEVISGRPNIDESVPQEQAYLSQWAWNLHDDNRLLELVDPTLRLSDEEEREVQQVIKVALLCIQNAAEKRPTMSRVVSILQNETDSEVQVQVGAGKALRAYHKLGTLLTVKEDISGSSINGKASRLGSDLTIDVELSSVRAR